MRGWALALWIAGCYNPTLRSGSPCDESQPCPGTLVCSAGTCELLASDLDASVGRDAPLRDGCTPAPEICGDGVDQDCDGVDPVCPPNDKAAGAIDVGAGGTFTGDLTFATDDSMKPLDSVNQPCGNDHGRDLYYKIHLGSNEAIYLDTFGSNFDSVIRVFHGSCIDGVEPSATTCHDNMCNTKQTQAVWDLFAGDNCIVIDQSSDAETLGSLTLHVEHGNRSGKPIALGMPVTGNTSAGTDQSIGSCSVTPAPDIGYHFTECPNQAQSFVASTCNANTNFDTVLYVRGPGTSNRCADDDNNCGLGQGTVESTLPVVTASGPHIFWLIVDGADPTTPSGAYQIDTILQ